MNVFEPTTFNTAQQAVHFYSQAHSSTCGAQLTRVKRALLFKLETSSQWTYSNCLIATFKSIIPSLSNFIRAWPLFRFAVGWQVTSVWLELLNPSKSTSSLLVQLWLQFKPNSILHILAWYLLHWLLSPTRASFKLTILSIDLDRWQFLAAIVNFPSADS